METTAAMNIPNEVYYVAGVIILTNMGTIGSLVYMGLKASWFLSKLDSRIDETKAAAVRAHKRIDKIESGL